MKIILFWMFNQYPWALVRILLKLITKQIKYKFTIFQLFLKEINENLHQREYKLNTSLEPRRCSGYILNKFIICVHKYTCKYIKLNLFKFTIIIRS